MDPRPSSSRPAATIRQALLKVDATPTLSAVLALLYACVCVCVCLCVCAFSLRATFLLPFFCTLRCIASFTLRSPDSGVRARFLLARISSRIAYDLLPHLKSPTLLCILAQFMSDSWLVLTIQVEMRQKVCRVIIKTRKLDKSSRYNEKARNCECN